MSDYKVEADFEHEGLRCVVLGLNFGHRCGYVGITKEHPLYGVDYNDCTEFLASSSIKNEPIGKRGIIPIMCADLSKETVSPCIYFDVHGGITYSGGSGKHPVESSGIWWFGYDCAHFGDAKDKSLMDAEKYDMLRQFEYGVVRTTDYCIAECKSLAEQLFAIK